MIIAFPIELLLTILGNVRKLFFLNLGIQNVMHMHGVLLLSVQKIIQQVFKLKQKIQRTQAAKNFYLASRARAGFKY